MPVTTKEHQYDPRINAKTRARILQRDKHMCRMCGRVVGDDNPVAPGKKVKIIVDQIDPAVPGMDDNLHVVCSACFMGKPYPLPNGGIEVLRTVRRAPRAIQRVVYDSLKKVFEYE